MTTTAELGQFEDPRYRLAYDEALRAISQQEATLNDLRSRAGLVLAALSVVTSFLGGTALAGGGGLEAMEIVATVCFVGAGTALVWLLWPREGWRFRFGPKRIIADYVESKEPADLDEMHRDLALHLAENLSANDIKLRRLWRGFELSCSLLVVEIVAWIVALAQQ